VLAQRPDAKVDDYFDVSLHYGTRRVCLRSSTLIARRRPRFAIHGTAGSFVKHGLDPQEAQLKAGMDPREPGYGVGEEHGTLTSPDGKEVTVPTERGNYWAFYEAIAAAILDGAPVPVEPEDARAGLMLIGLARKSAELGQVLPVPGASSMEGPAPQD
jgi:scyllo-inositol 2-dehydrogenase (NADP+)